MEKSTIPVVFIDDYPVYEDERWLVSVEDIEEVASDIRHNYMSADSEGYDNFAEVLFKIGDKYYLVEMEAEVESTWTDYGDVYHIGYLDSCTYKEVHVIERTAKEYKGEFVFEGNSNRWEEVKYFLEQNGVKFMNVKTSKKKE